MNNAFNSPEEYAAEIGRRTTLVPMLGTHFWQSAACALIDAIVAYEKTKLADLREQAAKLLADISDFCGFCGIEAEPKADGSCKTCGGVWRAGEFNGSVHDLERLLRAIAEEPNG